MDNLVFLKLGGSLITEKSQRFTSRPGKLRELGEELRDSLSDLPGLRLVLGHGSGSFGHFAVQENLNPAAFPPSTTGRPGTDRAFWRGFAEVWYRASQLNHIVVDVLHDAGLPVVSLPPSAAIRSADGHIEAWEMGPVRAALEAGAIPLIFGDIVFDRVLGGTVLSTEVLMWRLAEELKPRRILLAGLEEAVWADYPTRRIKIPHITPSTFAGMATQVRGSSAPDVTGGMKSKVEQMLLLVSSIPGLQAHIFSGEIPGNLRRILSGEAPGTIITGD